MPAGGYTTRIRVVRWAKGDLSDDYTDPTEVVVADQVAGAIDYASGSLIDNQIGHIATSTFFLTCDPCEMESSDEVIDLTGGRRYVVEEAFHVYDPSQPHVRATLQVSKVS